MPDARSCFENPNLAKDLNIPVGGICPFALNPSAPDSDTLTLLAPLGKDFSHSTPPQARCLKISAEDTEQRANTGYEDEQRFNKQLSRGKIQLSLVILPRQSVNNSTSIQK